MKQKNRCSGHPGSGGSYQVKKCDSVSRFERTTTWGGHVHHHPGHLATDHNGLF
jgi:hypothetical protein